MKLRYAVALVVVVDFLVAVALMQQAIIERASFRPPSVTTYGQYAVVMSWTGADDVDLYVRDPAGDVAFYASLQSGPLSLEHDTIPGNTDPVVGDHHETTVVRESMQGEYIANAHMYSGTSPVKVTVTLWDLRGNDRVLYFRTVLLGSIGDQATAFRWQLGQSGNYRGHNTLPADLLQSGGGTPHS